MRPASVRPTYGKPYHFTSIPRMRLTRPYHTTVYCCLQATLPATGAPARAVSPLPYRHQRLPLVPGRAAPLAQRRCLPTTFHRLQVHRAYTLSTTNTRCYLRHRPRLPPIPLRIPITACRCCFTSGDGAGGLGTRGFLCHTHLLPGHKTSPDYHFAQYALSVSPLPHYQ